eukprot:TRINITY_DN4091_c0_g1_i1.p1 TRINITY_DN4091_c0_g1~~TRINITY_DN4091_c0_g1_i1.p1  ORF type:complete len:804 (-),score=185.76 TRINITY_DN4091_c0_g1_i1:137-2548(-)
MAGSRTQQNKPHKTRFASKAKRHLHKVSDAKRIYKGIQSQVTKGGKAARLQHSKMIRDQKKAALLSERRAMSSPTFPPRIIVLFSLSSNVQLKKVKQNIISALASSDQRKFNDSEGMHVDLEGDHETEAISGVVCSSAHKLRLIVMEAPRDDILSCLEMAKVADIIAFVTSANISEGHTSNKYIDTIGEHCLSMFRALGLPSTVGLISDLPADLKKNHVAKKACISSLSEALPEECKIMPADSLDDCQKLIRHLCEKRLAAPQWRNQRPFVVADQVQSSGSEQEKGLCTLILSGYVRSRGLSVNQLVYVPQVGDFQLSQIDVLKDPFRMNERKKHDIDEMQLDESEESVIRTLYPTSEQELVIKENIPDPLAGEQTWPTQEELEAASRHMKKKKLKKRKLPPGTSDYQAAWIMDESDDEIIEDTDDTLDGMELDKNQDDSDQDANCSIDDDQRSVPFTVKDFDTDTQNDFMDDDKTVTREQMEDEIKKLKEGHADDRDFPDEVDTPMDIPARQRFAKYRGLKSFRTSKWDPKESLPEEYARIFQFDNYSRTYKHVLAKAKEHNNGNEDVCVNAGAYVRLHIKGVSLDVATRLVNSHRSCPVVACGLLQHETKMSVLNFSIKKCDFYENPIKSKEPLVFHVGFRQFDARPVFSSDDINMDKHKLERYLHPGNYCVASVFAPICFPPLPLIAFKEDACGVKLAAFGLLRSVDPDRIVLKRIILTGYPHRVSKTKALVRYMFHDPEDVRWFKPVELWTKYGRRGRMKEPVGTHGAMKCIFEGVIQQRDTVCMSLYKRVYPKWPEHH